MRLASHARPMLTVDVVVLTDAAVPALLLVQRAHPPFQDRWALPGGFVEADEQVAQAAPRELAEETGHAADDWEFMTSFYPSPGFLSEELHLFLAEGLRPAAAGTQLDVEEDDLRFEAMPLEGVFRRISEGEIRDAKSIIGIILARERLTRRD